MHDSLCVLGAGQIGRAIIYGAIERGYRRIHATSVRDIDYERLKGVLVSQFGAEPIGPSSLRVQRTKIQFHLLDVLPRGSELPAPEETEFFRLLDRLKPQHVVDGINFATAQAYRRDLAAKSSLVPWHVSRLHCALQNAGAEGYVKIGTTGIGGLSPRIPYSHGESGRPSEQLLAKSANAGAELALHFAYSRGASYRVSVVVPGCYVGVEEVTRGVADTALPMPLPKDAAEHVDPKSCYRWPIRRLVLQDRGGAGGDDRIEWRPEGALESAYVRAGEDGSYGLEDFRTITREDSMGLVSPEEVAEVVLRECEGRATGHNVLSAMESAVMSPSAIGSIVRRDVLERLSRLKRSGDAPTLPNIGPLPAKLLGELALLKALGYSTPAALATAEPKALGAAALAALETDVDFRQTVQALAGVGIPVRFNGDLLVTGPFVSVPGIAVDRASAILAAAETKAKASGAAVEEVLDQWTALGHADLRERATVVRHGPDTYRTGLPAWVDRARSYAECLAPDGPWMGTTFRKRVYSESQYLQDRADDNAPIEPGNMVAFVLNHEMDGKRKVW